MTQLVKGIKLRIPQLINFIKLNMRIKENRHVLIALLLGLIVFFGLSPGNGLTREGVMLLAIVVPTIYMWLFVNTTWVSLLFLGLLVLTESMTDNQVWAGSLGHFSVMLIIAFFLLSECLNETKVIQKIANWFITRPFVEGKPYLFMTMFFGSNLLIGIFMQNLALAIIYVTLTAKICENLEIQKGDSLYNALMLGTFWGNTVLSISSPIAKALPNILIGLVQTNLGVQISYAQWLMVGIPFSILAFGVIMLVIRVMNPDTTALKTFKASDVTDDEEPMSQRGKIALFGMALLIVVILFPEIFLALNLFVPVSSYFSGVGATAPAIVLIVVLCLIHVKENDSSVPVMDFAKSSKTIPINLLLFISAVVIMGVPMASDDTGVIMWIHNGLLPLTELFSSNILMLILVVITVVITNFVSNTVALTISFYLGMALSVNMSINPVAFAVTIAFAACMACLTPSSIMTATLYYGPEHLKVNKVVKPNLLFLAGATLVTMTMIPLVIAVMG